MTKLVSIEGLSRASVLASLYNASAPILSELDSVNDGPQVMSESYAQGLINAQASTLKFNYLYGRRVNVDLSSDMNFDPSEFDRGNGGEGFAQRVIDSLRQTGDVNSKFIGSLHAVNLVSNGLLGGIFLAADPESVEIILDNDVWAELDHEPVLEDLPKSPSFRSVSEQLNWVMAHALSYFRCGSTKSADVFTQLVKLNPETAWLAAHQSAATVLRTVCHSRRLTAELMESFTTSR